jgi:hypothetical protein
MTSGTIRTNGIGSSVLRLVDQTVTAYKKKVDVTLCLNYVVVLQQPIDTYIYLVQSSWFAFENAAPINHGDPKTPILRGTWKSPSER